MKDIKVLGIDLAKNVFQLHGTDAKGPIIGGASDKWVPAQGGRDGMKLTTDIF